MKKHKYVTPAIFSFFMIGLGQIVKGDSDRGLKWVLFFYLFYPLLIYVTLMINARIFVATMAVGVIVYPVFWLYNVYDAYNRKIER